MLSPTQMKTPRETDKSSSTPECPSFEPLTPKSDKDVFDPSEDSNSASENAFQSLTDRLRLPLALERILAIEGDSEMIFEITTLLLQKLSPTDINRIRNFSHILERSCDALSRSGTAIAETGYNTKRDPSERSDTDKSSLQMYRDHCSLQDTHSSKEPEDNQSLNIRELEVESLNDSGSDCDGSKCTGIDDPVPKSFIRGNATFNQNTKELMNDAVAESEVLAACVVDADESEGTEPSVTDVSTSTNLVNRSNSMPSSEVESQIDLTEAESSSTIHDHENVLCLVSQSISSFINRSYQQVKKFAVPRNNTNTYKSLLGVIVDEKEEKGMWSDGSEWKSLIDAGGLDRDLGSIHYALTSIAFARWHETQVKLSPLQSSQAAPNEVSCRILGPRPKKQDTRCAEWKRRRKALTTNITRGRKWSDLARALGPGILFDKSW